MQEYLILLRQILTERFGAEELRTLCFDLGIDYDDLPGRGKIAKARELVAHLERRERILDCIQAGRQARPDIPWEQVQLAWLEAAQREAPDPRRFQPLIEELQATIAHWEGRVERQRERIADGLEEQRQQRMEQQKRREKGRLRAVGQPPLNVADTFKDRQRDLQKLGQLLAEPTTRLVSVVGHGGMGKTALACKVLQDLERHRWPHTDREVPIDGIVYLSTRTAGISLERLFLDCTKLLGGKQQERLNAVWTNPQLETQEKIARLLVALSEGRYVILLDNLEDLLDDRSQLTDDDLRLFFDRALTTAWGAQLVVTSRVALAFRREVMRFDRQVKLLEGLPVEDGVVLLRELDPNGDYGLRDAPEEQLAEAVELAHGVPRALEVLAGILANDPFATLDEVVETFYEQEGVVQALIEENYQRLDRDARRVIEALAVFRRPVPPLGIDYLLEPFAPGLDVPSVVRRLARTNTVSVDRAAKTVTLHPIDQDYAYSQLLDEESTELDYTRQALERRAADYYVQLRTPEETWKSIDDLEPQLNEFEHRVRAGDYDDAGRVLSQIDYDYLFMWGRYARLIEMRKKLLDHLKNPSLQAENLGRLGNICSSGRTDSVVWAVEQYNRALGITREIGDRKNESIWLRHLGSAYSNLGKFRQTMRCYNEALAIAREINDRQNEGICLNRLGRAHSFLGKFKTAIKLYKEGLIIAREINDRRGEGLHMGYLSRAHRNLGQTKRCIVLCEEALKIAREIGYRRNEVIWLNRLGSVYRDSGQFERAIEFYEEALGIAHELNYHRGKSHQYLGLGKTFLIIREYAQAHKNCQESLALRTLDTTYQTLLVLGIVLLHQRNEEAIGAFFDAAERCRKRLNETSDLYQPSFSLATALIGQAVCDPRWVDESQRPELLAPALTEYHRALAITAAPGVVQDAVRDLELIQAAGIEGLEPAFELLESAEYEPDVPQDLPDLIPIEEELI